MACGSMSLLIGPGVVAAAAAAAAGGGVAAGGSAGSASAAKSREQQQEWNCERQTKLSAQQVVHSSGHATGHQHNIEPTPQALHNTEVAMAATRQDSIGLHTLHFTTVLPLSMIAG